MKRYSGLYTATGEPVLTQEYAQSIRDEDSRFKIMAQAGGQEDCLASPAQLIFYGGKRGSGKSYILLDAAVEDILNRNFRACLLRNEKPDLTDLIEVSYELYGQYGDYNRSQNDMTWNFNSGAKLKFSYYEGDYEAFKKRFQGKQFAYIGLDEVTHCPYKKFKYLLTDNRNAYGIRTHFLCTCNPDPDSWVATFLFNGGWLDYETGYPIPKMNGVIRYCYMPGNDVNEVVFGETREEVFNACKTDILKHWRSDFAQYGSPQELFIFSVAFIEGKLEDNRKLMKSDPTYLARLANQDEEQQSRDLDGNWKFRSAGDDLIKMDDMIRFYDNAFQCTTEDNANEEQKQSKLYATADVALQGGDNFVMWLWQGWHIKDVFVCRFDSKTLVEVIHAKLSEWGVEEHNFAYDFQGIGQLIEGFFPNAVKFINQAAPVPMSKQEEEGVKKLYKDLKSQCAVLLYKKFRDVELSIDPHILDYTFDGHGYGKTKLRDILMKERKCIRRTKESQGKAFQLISKSDMKKIIGHSPDFFESLLFRFIFTLIKKKHRKARNTWCI